MWEGRYIDRPCIAVTAPSGKNVEGPPAPVSAEQKWLDPDWIVRNALAKIENTWWGGEAVPWYLVMSGWAVCFGAELRFNMNTIWHDRITVNFDRPPAFTFDPEAPWVKKFEAAYCALAEAAGKDDFIVGQPCILPANDLFSMIMGTETFLIGLLDHPEWMREAFRQGTRSIIEAYHYFRDRLIDHHDYWYGYSYFQVPEPFMATQSDVSCMISPELFNEFILPELELYSNEIGPLWYHLDGGDARQHVPSLLNMPNLRAVQYTPRLHGLDPIGPELVEFYKEIQAAGKIAHITHRGTNTIETLVKELDPALLLIQTGCGSIKEGKALLEAAEGWTREKNK